MDISQYYMPCHHITWSYHHIIWSYHHITWSYHHPMSDHNNIWSYHNITWSYQHIIRSYSYFKGTYHNVIWSYRHIMPRNHEITPSNESPRTPSVVSSHSQASVSHRKPLKGKHSAPSSKAAHKISKKICNFREKTGPREKWQEILRWKVACGR